MTDPAPGTPSLAPGGNTAETPEEEIDYGKGIYDRLGELNERLKGWDGLLTRETNTETSSDPANPDTTNSPAAPEMATRAAAEATPDPAPANSPNSGDQSPEARAGDSSSATPPQPTLDTSTPPKAERQRQNEKRKSPGFLKGGKRRQTSQ